MTITFDLTPPSCPKTEEKMDRPQAVMALEQSREQISPATDLPMELLAAIFEYHCETIRLNPLDMSQPPWILGRVCTQWRAVSRNSSALWGSPRLELEVLKDILHLERALEVLPLRVMLVLSCRQTFDLSLLSPYMHRCNQLDSVGLFEEFNKFLRSCPLDSFQNLHDVKITFWQRENFVCDPVIPGGYDMDVNGGVADDNTHGDAVFQVAAGPWDNAQKLSGVEFICSFWYCHALLNPSFSRIPLTQLECLVLDSVRMQMKPLCLMLEGCKSLKTLKIDLLLTGSKNLPMDTCLQFPHLQKLTLDGAAVLLIPIMYCWTNLSSFSASRFRVENERKVQDALRQCVNLKKLSIAAFYLPHEWLHIPLLQSLCVRMHESTHPIPSFNLVLPNLMHLDVTDYWDTAGADLLPVIEMLKASQCSLTHFECQTFVSPTISQSLCRLITTISPTATSVICSMLMISDASILRDIGRGTLLPNVSNFKCCVEPAQSILDFMEARITRETELRWDKRFIFRSLQTQRIEMRLREICQAHGIKLESRYRGIGDLSRIIIIGCSQEPLDKETRDALVVWEA